LVIKKPDVELKEKIKKRAATGVWLNGG